MGSRVWSALVLTLLYLCGGCSRSPHNIAPVDGRILFNGLPARASIVSQIVDEKGEPQGRPSTADTLADGTFSLIYTENQPGALIGTHRVLISIYPVEREVGEFDFQTRFRPVKVVRFTRQVAADTPNRWIFPLTY